MNTCIMCGKGAFADDGYVTDGKIFVCRKCAEITSFRDITVRISNSGVDSNILYVREAPIEADTNSETGYYSADGSPVTSDDLAEHEAPTSSLVDQTASPHVELDKAYIDERDGSPIPNGCSKDCPHWPYDTCGHYYGETHECMLMEEEIDADVENMSEEDFMSKYCDNPNALNAWADAHLDGPAFN